jgi:hypothetical protein
MLILKRSATKNCIHSLIWSLSRLSKRVSIAYALLMSLLVKETANIFIKAATSMQMFFDHYKKISPKWKGNRLFVISQNKLNNLMHAQTPIEYGFKSNRIGHTHI